MSSPPTLPQAPWYNINYLARARSYVDHPPLLGFEEFFGGGGGPLPPLPPGATLEQRVAYLEQQVAYLIQTVGYLEERIAVLEGSAPIPPYPWPPYPGCPEPDPPYINATRADYTYAQFNTYPCYQYAPK